MDRLVRKKVKERSGGRCEVYFETEVGQPVRCPNEATEIHHMITRARGGHHLDKFDLYHLIHACRSCHNASSGKQAYDGGLLIKGYVEIDKLEDRPVYHGPDEYLSKRFGP